MPIVEFLCLIIDLQLRVIFLISSYIRNDKIRNFKQILKERQIFEKKKK